MKTLDQMAAEVGAAIIKLRLQHCVTRWALVPTGVSPREAAERALIYRTRGELARALAPVIGEIL